VIAPALFLALEPQRAELDDLIRLGVILLFVLGPVLKKVFEAKAEAGAAPRPKPRRMPPRTVVKDDVAWGELLASLPEAPKEEAPVFLPPQPSEVEREIHAEPLVPTSVLSDVGHEDDVELIGGMPSMFDEVGALPEVSEYSENEAELVPEFHHIGDEPEDGLGPGVAATEIGKSWRPEETDWRRAVIAQEVLGLPLSMRKEQSHPGPVIGIL